MGPNKQGELLVYDRKNERQLDESDIDDYSSLLLKDKQVFYSPYEDRVGTSTRLMTKFPGIGRKTVEKIGPEIITVNEMIDGFELDERFREAVPNRFHDELWAELKSFEAWAAERSEDLSSIDSRPNSEKYLEDGDRIDPEGTIPGSSD